ncbi:MAG TPA: LUD domain-containing protein, partial [Spirochaetota bacterium]|nr:LUD domain-containing protein [Spirochaetota bacterium]
MNEKNRLKELIISKTVHALRKNFFTVHVADSAKDALDYLVKTIPVDSSIGFGGSRTLEEIGFFDEFTKQKYTNLFDRNDKTLSTEQKRLLQLSALGADYFVSSCNA